MKKNTFVGFGELLVDKIYDEKGNLLKQDGGILLGIYYIIQDLWEKNVMLWVLQEMIKIRQLL